MLQIVTILGLAARVAADQAIKYVVVRFLEPIGSFPFIDRFLQFTYVENTGAAFGFFSRHTELLSVFTGIVIAAGLIFLLSGKLKSKFAHVAVLMILAGGLGNLIDRVVRGFVVDYIEPLFINFAVFNFADMLVCVGAALLIGYLIFDMIRDARKDPLADKETVEHSHESD